MAPDTPVASQKPTKVLDHGLVRPIAISLAAIGAAVVVFATISLGEGSTSPLIGRIGVPRPTIAPAVEQSLANNDYLLFATFSRRASGHVIVGAIRMTALNEFPYKLRLQATISPDAPSLHIYFGRHGLVYPNGVTNMIAIASRRTPPGDYVVTVLGTARDGTIREASATLHVP